MRESIKFSARGNWDKTFNFFDRALGLLKHSKLDSYGQAGVTALMSATPVRTGETAASWFYTVERTEGRAKIIWHNGHIHDGVNIAVILQYGHGTRNGGWVEGIDYINPALLPTFERIADDAWKEVTK